MRTFLLFLILTGSVASMGNLWSQTTYASDGTQADVNAKLALAVSGDTVTMPAGTTTEWGWNGSTSVYTTIPAGVTLQGAGIDVTYIVLSTSGPAWADAVINLLDNTVFRDVTIQTPVIGAGRVTAVNNGGSGKDFRITSVKYTNRTTDSSAGYFFYCGASDNQNPQGLMDNCIVQGPASGTQEWIWQRGPANSWQTDDTMGTQYNFFIEDCLFERNGYTDFNANARAVVRYTDINGAIKIDQHGAWSNTPRRSARHVEVYGLRFLEGSGGGGWVRAMHIRGGTGFYWDVRGTLDGVGDPNTHGNWNFDQDEYPANNSVGDGVYPFPDQNGRGKDLDGSSTVVYSNDEYPPGSFQDSPAGWYTGAAASQPAYCWLNRRHSGDTTEWVKRLTVKNDETLNTSLGVLQLDRDIYQEAVSFDGSSGVGVGTKAQMEAIDMTGDTLPVGFWVTDEADWNSDVAGPDGQLYVWNNGTQTWDLEYTPYTYPHPLRTGGAGQSVGTVGVANAGAVNVGQ